MSDVAANLKSESVVKKLVPRYAYKLPLAFEPRAARTLSLSQRVSRFKLIAQHFAITLKRWVRWAEKLCVAT